MTDGAPANYPPEDVVSGKVLAILSYLCCVIWLIAIIQKNNAFALFHAKQALGLTAVVLVMMIPCTILSMIPFIWFLGMIVSMVVGLAALAFIIMGIMNAAGGQYKSLPVVGPKIEDLLKGIQKA